jgi:predicted TIM-barrel fold metal-dependent hydrolase
LHFPKIRFVIPHFGAGMLRETLMVADLCANVYVDTSSSNRWMAYEALDLRDVFNRTLSVVGPERVLFGSDSSFFPRGWHAEIFKNQSTALYELGIPQQTAEQIFSANFDRLFPARTAGPA